MIRQGRKSRVIGLLESTIIEHRQSFDNHRTSPRGIRILHKTSSISIYIPGFYVFMDVFSLHFSIPFLNFIELSICMLFS